MMLCVALRKKTITCIMKLVRLVRGNMDLRKEPRGLPLWKTQDAKAEFARLVREAAKQDQVITNRDEEVVVVMSKKRYDKLMKKPTSLLEFFKRSPLQEVDLDIERNRDLPRDIDL